MTINKGKFSLSVLTGIMMLFSVFHSYGQEYSFGLKAGSNYSLGNDGSELTGSLGQFSAKSSFGYLLGGFAEIGYNKFLIRPEIFYSHVASKFDIQNRSIGYSFDKINIPLLIGFNVYGPIDVFIGPSYQNITDAYLQDTKEKIELEQNNFNLHFGVKFIYSKWEVDLRYEYMPPKGSNQIVDINNVMDNAFFDDGRLNNIMLSLNYKIFDSENYTENETIDK